MKKLLISIICFSLLLTIVGCSKKKITTKNNGYTRETVELLESELENQICNIAEYLNDATFAVLNYNDEDSDKATSLGSGVIYKKVINENNSYTYYLVTNRHVIEGGEKFKVYSYDNKTISATSLGYSETYDIGVLTFVSYEKHNVVPIADVNSIRQGESCFAMGTPLYTTYVNTFTKGNVSAIRSAEIQHTADINSGNSGGPLVNLNGELIGINRSKISNNTQQVDIDGMCFAVRCDKVIEAINEIEKNNDAVTSPILGMTVTDVDNVTTYNYDTFDDFWTDLKNSVIEVLVNAGYSPQYADAKFEDLYASKKSDYLSTYNDLHAFNTYIPSNLDNGMLIRDITSNSVSDEAGLKIGDIVTKINDITVTNQTTFSKEFFKYNVGDSFTITIIRGEETKTVTINL